MRHVIADTRRLRQRSDLHSVRPNHLAVRAPWDVPPPWAKDSGSQIHLLTPWYDGRVEIIPFRCLPVFLAGKGTSHVGRDTGELPPRENNGFRSPPAPGFAQSVAPVAPQCHLTPSGWHTLRAGAWHRRRRVVASVVPHLRAHRCQGEERREEAGGSLWKSGGGDHQARPRSTGVKTAQL